MNNLDKILAQPYRTPEQAEADIAERRANEARVREWHRLERLRRLGANEPPLARILDGANIRIWHADGRYEEIMSKDLQSGETE